ncbi:PRC and DUF2382 domain-containing protein [Deinococcus pimensis]|uniref:PRC and DUF2382 domain-containing protein n=1 Tax=Deinococcus pimensis TaxID=309888 RepID=UPI0004882F7C|nr:DUF2382 domain-containing protein [Deinococcus pimensis]
MASLIPLSDLVRDRNYDFATDNVYDPTGKNAYGMDGHKIGAVRGAMVEPDTGRLRYLIVDVGGWFVSKEVLVPVGMARVEDDGVYFDNLTKDQVKEMREYRYGQDYDYDAQVGDERVLRGSGYAEKGSYRNEDSMTLGADTDSTIDRGVAGTVGVGAVGDTTTGLTNDTSLADTARMDTTTRRYDYRDTDQSDALFKTPKRLQLLEERLSVDKDRYVAGSVEIGKHVETRQQNVNVELQHEELIIERRPVTDPRPVDGNVTLGAASETVRVDLEAERAEVVKQAFVTEEVEVGKRTETESRTFTETVGREVLDVNKTGSVDLHGADGTTLRDGATTNREGLLERADEAIDRLDGKIDRDHNR